MVLVSWFWFWLVSASDGPWKTVEDMVEEGGSSSGDTSESRLRSALGPRAVAAMGDEEKGDTEKR